MQLHFPTSINKFINGTYSFTNSLGVTKTSIQNPNYLVELGTGLQTMKFKAEIGACFFEKSKNVTVVNVPTITHSNLNLPDTVLSSSPEITLSNYFTASGHLLESNSIGTRYNPDLKFSPYLANSGNNIIQISSIDTNTGCTGIIIDTIFVKFDPGTPTPAYIDYFTSGIHNQQLQGKWVSVPPSPFTPPGTTYYRTYYQYKELNLCDGETRMWHLKNPKIGSTNPTLNLTYSWFLDNGTSVDTLGTGISKSITIPNNGMNNQLRLIIVSENYLGSKNSVTQLINSWKKPTIKVEQNLSNCYSLNDTIKILEQWHNFRQSDTAYIRSNNVIDSSSKIRLLSSTNDTTSLHYSLINKSNIKYQNNIYSLKYEYPYSKFQNNDFHFTETDSIIYGVLGTIPSGPIDLFSVYYNKLNRFIDTCICSNIDTVVTINNPIARYRLSYQFAPDSIVLHGDLMSYVNLSRFADIYYWDYMNGNYSFANNSNQYIYDQGWNHLELTASDTINYCYNTITDSNLFFAQVISSINNEESLDKISVFPNPFIDNINLVLESKKYQKITVSLYDSKGSMLFTMNENINSGSNKLNYNLSHYEGSLFYLRINNEEINQTLKIIKND